MHNPLSPIIRDRHRERVLTADAAAAPALPLQRTRGLQGRKVLLETWSKDDCFITSRGEDFAGKDETYWALQDDFCSTRTCERTDPGSSQLSVSSEVFIDISFRQHAYQCIY